MAHRHPSLRTVRAVFPHTALQSVVSASRPSRCLPGRVKRELPTFAKLWASHCPLTPLPAPTASVRSRPSLLPPRHRVGHLHRDYPSRELPVLCVLQSWTYVSTFLPTFPRTGFAIRPFTLRFGPGRIGTMRALTPVRFAHTGQVSPLRCIAVRTSRPQPRHDARASLSQSLQRTRSGDLAPRLRHE